MLKDMEKNPGAMGIGKAPSHDVSSLPKYEDLDITYMQAHRWQLEALVPEDKLEQFIAEATEKADEITSRAVLSMAMKIRNEAKKEPTSDGVIPAGLCASILGNKRVHWKCRTKQPRLRSEPSVGQVKC